MEVETIVNGYELTKAGEFRIDDDGCADFEPPPPSGNLSVEIKKTELAAEQRVLWDLYNFQKRTEKPHLVRVKNPVEIFLGV